MTRTPLVAGNWKMHKTTDEAVALVRQMLPLLEGLTGVECLVCIPYPSLQAVWEILRESSLKLGAQDVFWKDEGAYTGEVSPPMLKEFCSYVIVGHSERRQIFRESDENIQRKVEAVLRHGMRPILAVGETLAEREAGKTYEVVEKQLRRCLQGVTTDQAEDLVVAYEPVWAIGSGLPATPKDASSVIGKSVRTTLAVLFGGKAAKAVRVLYGGSVNPSNAREFFAEETIDGALVGGASLDADGFSGIALAAQR